MKFTILLLDLAQMEKIRLSDVAKIRDQFSETPLSSTVNNDTAIILSVTSTNNEDMMDSAKKINQYLSLIHI